MAAPGLPSPLTRQARRIRRRLERSELARARNRFLSGRAGERRDFILVCDGRVYTSEQQFAPIYRHARRIARETGLIVQSRSLERLIAGGPSALAPNSVVGLMLPYDMDPEDVVALIDRVIRPARHRGVRFVLFDGDDDLAVLWRDVLAAVDLCVKKHGYANRSQYEKPTTGKSNLTDYVARTAGWSFADNIIPSAGNVAQTDIGKIRIGWNIALDDKIVDLARDIPPLVVADRPVDILCRASVGPDIWTYPMRNGAVEAIGALAGGVRVLAPTDRVSQAAYYREMLSAKMSLSPFGFGEICWRDFESILCGSVLVKPDMSHVDTAPDLFVPGETYVPVAWDYSDLAEKVAIYLGDDQRRRAMAERARSTLLSMLTPDWFMARFRAEVVEPLGL